jgi:hypothetical protein
MFIVWFFFWTTWTAPYTFLTFCFPDVLPDLCISCWGDLSYDSRCDTIWCGISPFVLPKILSILLFPPLYFIAPLILRSSSLPPLHSPICASSDGNRSLLQLPTASATATKRVRHHLPPLPLLPTLMPPTTPTIYCLLMGDTHQGRRRWLQAGEGGYHWQRNKDHGKKLGS